MIPGAPRTCTWCGHPAHDAACPVTVTVRTSRTDQAETRRPCTCALIKHEQEDTL